MKSSEARAVGTTALPVLLIVAACLGVGRIRPWLATHYHELGSADDVYALPSPQQTVGVSLGYRAALADLIYANTLVGYGIRAQEQRRFEFAGNYLDTVIELDPTLREVYLFADTILTLQPRKPPFSDYLKAREIHARGLEQFPNDPELWLTAGQYLSYLAPSAIEDPKIQHEWRLAGDRLLAHVCEIGAYDRAYASKCIGAAVRLSKEAKERDAVIHFLNRVLAVSTDPVLRAKARNWLQVQLKAQVREDVAQRWERLDAARREDLPFVPHDVFVLLGPPVEPWRCAGLEAWRDEECATSWSRRLELQGYYDYDDG